jgi:hypothetical protein
MFSTDTMNGSKGVIRVRPGFKRLIKKVWEVSWDMWDHRNEVRTTTITPATMRETEKLNEQIIEQFEGGAARLGQQDYHLLAKPLAHVLGCDLDHKSQWGWNQLRWPEYGL